MRERLYRLAGGILLLASLLAGWYGYGYQTFVNAPLGKQAAGASFQVSPGASLAGISRELEQAGHISDAGYFVWMARLSGQARQIRAGEYLLTAEMTARQLLQQMVEGRVQLHSLTLIEGWHYRQVLDAVRNSPHLQQTLPDDGLAAEELMKHLGRPGIHPEGRFFPDTYHFPRGMSDVEFLRRALQRMEEVLQEEWSAREEALPLKNADEALVLASIIEKETARSSERETIAGVFVRRLQKGMRLQTDPTVIYGRGLDVSGRITYRDLRTDTPYNTYTRHGLPPTPIAMPGRESIHAALHPADGHVLYFVSRGDGSHQFSATLEEHNRAVQTYQIKRKP